MASPDTGSQLIAQSLHSLGVKVIFGIVGIPVIEVAEACIALGIKFVSFRNEQAASYAASAYGFLTGRPGVCLVVGGPGVLHAMAGVGNSTVNATFPLLLLAGSSETTAGPTKGAFQQLDAVSLLAPHTKLAVRPPSLEQLPESIREAYRTAFWGRPGVGFVDLPADFIQGTPREKITISPVQHQPRVSGSPAQIRALADALRGAKKPLIIIGKGCAYARSEDILHKFIETTNIPFLPTPQGKGVLSDNHPLNIATARSAALKNTDVAVLLGARLNWILHFGETPKWSSTVRIAQVDISPEELGRGGTDPALSVTGDITEVVTQLHSALSGWRYSDASWHGLLSASSAKNIAAADKKAAIVKNPLGYHRSFTLLREHLERLAGGSPDDIVYVSEGANTMDISRSIFSVTKPRQRLDAGTYATMGVGLGYAIAAEIAYNHTRETGTSTRKRVVAIEGDSAFGFSLPEIETMSRYRLPIIVVVVNNGGVYRGTSDNSPAWGTKVWDADKEGKRSGQLLPSTALSFETGYDVVAEGLGGRGWKVRTEEELERAVKEAWAYGQGPSVINLIIESGSESKLEFNWLGKKESKL